MAEEESMGLLDTNVWQGVLAPTTGKMSHQISPLKREAFKINLEKADLQGKKNESNLSWNK